MDSLLLLSSRPLVYLIYKGKTLSQDGINRRNKRWTLISQIIYIMLKSSYVFIYHFISQSFTSYVIFYIQILRTVTVFSINIALALFR